MVGAGAKPGWEPESRLTTEHVVRSGRGATVRNSWVTVRTRIRFSKYYKIFCPFQG